MIVNTIMQQIDAYVSRGYKPTVLYLSRNKWHKLLEETKGHAVYCLRDVEPRKFSGLEVVIVDREQWLAIGVGL